MRKLIVASLVALGPVFSFLACGGDPKPPPTTPTASASASESTSASADASASASASSAVLVPKVVLPLNAMKFTPAKGKKTIEVKADGTVMVDTKPVGKVVGDHLEDTAGKTLLTLGPDGVVSGDGVPAGLKFEGDDLIAPDGKITIGDDGTTKADGKKKETLGKWDAVGTAKKTAALVLTAMMLVKSTSGSPTSASAVPSTSAKPPKGK